MFGVYICTSRASFRLKIQTVLGRLAQWLERVLHTPEVGGSTPPAIINLLSRSLLGLELFSEPWQRDGLSP